MAPRQLNGRHAAKPLAPLAIRSSDGRTPPHDLDAEAAVLSAVMLDPEALAKVPLLEHTHFYSEAHQRIFEAIRAVSAMPDGRVDVVLVGGWLKREGRLAQIGGAKYLADILGASAHVGNVASYARTVVEKWRMRRAIEALQLLTAEAYIDGIGDVQAWLDAGVSRVATIAEDRAERSATVLTGVELSEPLGPIPWLVEGLRLAPGAPTFMSGPTFVAKTMVMQDIALAVASGGSALGTYGVRRGPVVHLDYDGQGERITRERYQRLARARGVDLRELPITYQRRGLIPIDDPAAEAALRRRLEGAALCLIDSWRGATPSTDEWRRDGVQLVGDVLERLSHATGCTIVVVDHETKPQADGSTRAGTHAMHGSSAKGEIVQAHFRFRPPKDEADPVKVEITKERIAGRVPAPFGIRVEDILGNNGDPRWGLRVVHVDRAEFAEPSGEERAASAVHRDAVALARYVAAHPGCESTSARAVACGNTGRRYALAKDILGHALLTTRNGRAATLTLDLARLPPSVVL